MSAYEIMLSESQERMLFIIHKGMEEKAIAICNKWDVPITQIGVVTDSGVLNIWRNGKQVCQMQAEPLVLGGGAPQYDRETKEPQYIKETRKFDFKTLETKDTVEQAFWKILKTPAVASKKWVFEQYDSQVRTNTVNIKGDAAVMRLKELPGKGFATKTDCASRFAYLNPYMGAMAAVAEAARNVVCVGAEPVAITNCLNFGNPYDPEVYWQFTEAIRGMGDACRALNTPVTGGNVSFHNESKNRAIFPTPTIGMLGLIDDLDKIMSAGFKNEGDAIYLIGNDREELGGSEWLKQIHGIITGEAPILDIEEEKRLQKVVLTAIREKLINSAHDCAEGGLAICLAEKAILSDNNLGANILLEGTHSKLFSESHSRVVVSLNPAQEAELADLCKANNINCKKIGRVAKDEFCIHENFKTTVKELKDVYYGVLPGLMEG
jgi:phosphoribosylformylglycinamidine synthase